MQQVDAAGYAQGSAVFHILAGLALLTLVQAGNDSLSAYCLLLGLAIGALGMVFGNLTALTIGDAGKQTGVASALMGLLQYLMSAVIGYFVSLAPQGLYLMPLTLALCGMLAGVTTVLAGHSGPKTAVE